MVFSAEDRVRLQQDFDRIRMRLWTFQNSPERLPSITDGQTHILRRFERLAAMSDEELMEEIESDYVIFGY